MDDDDRLVGRVLSRREVLQLLAIGSAAASGLAWRDDLLALGQAQSPAGTAGSVPQCVVRPELEEGPYFSDVKLDRLDIRADPTTGKVAAGLPLTLAFAVSQIGRGTCTPLAGAIVDVWHCDAAGVYSGVAGRGQPTEQSTSKFLRGFQLTDAQGQAKFTTIYPGRYQGRAVHIHFKIRTSAAPSGAYDFTSQLFFDDKLTDEIHGRAPYASRGRRDTLNQTDGIYRSGGAEMLLKPVRQGDALVANTVAIGLDLSDIAIGRSDGMRGGRGPGRPGGPGRGRGRG